MGMKKKMLSATLCAVMVGSLAAPAFTVQAADDTLVYWSMWEATEPQGQVIQEAVRCKLTRAVFLSSVRLTWRIYRYG